MTTARPVPENEIRAALAPARLLGADLNRHYRRERKRKSDGSFREIAEPVGVLRDTQDWLVTHVWPAFPILACAHGFVTGRSIVTNAAVHAPCHTLLTLDIHDFFGSVSDAAVVEILCTAGLPRGLAVAIARICTLPNGLPQGAPTSPGLANACFGGCDAGLTALAASYNARYSRYVDDLAFSWVATPAPLAVSSVYTGTALILEVHGFTLAHEKRRLAGPGAKQQLTGLVINAEPGCPAIRAPREKWRALRAALHNAAHGVETDYEALHGLASFLAMTDPDRAAPYLERIAELRKLLLWEPPQ